MFFASHNEYVNHHARTIIVGITPGWTQMEKSIRLSKAYLEQELPQDEILNRVKKECRFAGSLRNNLIDNLIFYSVMKRNITQTLNNKVFENFKKRVEKEGERNERDQI